MTGRKRRPDRQPPGFQWLGTARVGAPDPVYIFAVTARSSFFRPPVHNLRALDVCHRRESHRCSTGRHPTDRAIFIAFVLSAALSGLSGLSWFLSRQRFAERRIGLDSPVVTAVVLGGASLSGGRGSIVGTTLAVLIVGVLGKGSSSWLSRPSGSSRAASCCWWPWLDQVRVRFSPETS